MASPAAQPEISATFVVPAINAIRIISPSEQTRTCNRRRFEMQAQLIEKKGFLSRLRAFSPRRPPQIAIARRYRGRQPKRSIATEHVGSGFLIPPSFSFRRTRPERTTGSPSPKRHPRAKPRRLARAPKPRSFSPVRAGGAIRPAPRQASIALGERSFGADDRDLRLHAGAHGRPFIQGIVGGQISGAFQEFRRAEIAGRNRGRATIFKQLPERANVGHRSVTRPCRAWFGAS